MLYHCLPSSYHQLSASTAYLAVTQLAATPYVIHQLDIRTCTAQNCSQTLLQRFNDAVITFLAWWRWSQHHQSIAIKFVNNFEHCMSEYRAGVYVHFTQAEILWFRHSQCFVSACDQYVWVACWHLSIQITALLNESVLASFLCQPSSIVCSTHTLLYCK